MQINLNVSSGYDGRVHEIFRLFFPQARVVYGQKDGDLHGNLTVREESDFLELQVDLTGCLEGRQRIIVNSRENKAEVRRELLRLTYLLLVQVTSSKPSPYGILTGVRPTKLVHSFLDRGYSRVQIEEELLEKFLVNRDKIDLLIDVASHNRPYLVKSPDVSRNIGVYIGIPYCPSRCHYCSFPGYSLGHHLGVSQFLKGLIYELNRVGQELQDAGFTIEYIYIGGGTPTVLSMEEWRQLLEPVHRFYLSGATREFTVEAGRPDTFDHEVLCFLVENGVNRICVNPQTMNDSTLNKIGRLHTSAMTIEAFQKARQAGFRNINMDLIAGLPGEGPEEFENSLKALLQLGPEGITVHHLARKRGSTWDMQNSFAEGKLVGESIVGNAYQHLIEEGYLPYYLYRQKRMAGNQENIGFALPGFFGEYNIQVIEERQTIIGFGGGSASKFVDINDLSISNHHHPQDPATYLLSLERLIKGQVDRLRALP